MLLLLACGSEPELPKGGPWEPCTNKGACDDTEHDRCFYFYSGSDQESSVCAPQCEINAQCPAGPMNRGGSGTTLTCDHKGFCLLECTDDQSCPDGMNCLQPGEVSDLDWVCIWDQ